MEGGREKDPESETDEEGGKGALEAQEALEVPGPNRRPHTPAQCCPRVWPAPLPVWLVTRPSVVSSFWVNASTAPSPR